jgi:hypothetical protein
LKTAPSITVITLTWMQRREENRVTFSIVEAFLQERLNNLLFGQ